ncbi:MULTISPECIES: UDP-N-acetylglucosamine 2-epimerase [unclassified Lysinibacillus]|uniref:UDP-N-acetylglucosamine 2-epimerase n=1 Tax=unclassified Lysinibacillus TaxID=2636778 RepID=UPI0037F6902A
MKICFITATRAEYGLLKPLIKKIQMNDYFELKMIVTGMHLSSEFGLTFKQIEEDGFKINEKVEALLSSDTAIGVAKSMGLTTIGFADAFARLEPDLIVILGDRFEMLAVAQVALVMQIPIAHIHGGECTFGAYDDAIRHSITKMATWHFTSTEMHRKRVIQLGEHPDRVWNVGAIGIENTKKLQLISKEDIYRDLGLNIELQTMLITYHPETVDNENGITELINALSEFTQFNLVFTKANADNGGRYINQIIQEFVQTHKNAFLFDALGQLKYLSMVQASSVVIGNSSSALIEVPYLHTPAVNIGTRQAGREKPDCVFDSQPNKEAIINGIEKALTFKGPFNEIFGDGNTSDKIIEILSNLTQTKVEKGFYDL